MFVCILKEFKELNCGECGIIPELYCSCMAIILSGGSV